MIMGDLDGDGDLDIVVNNLRGQAQIFENRLCRPVIVMNPSLSSRAMSPVQYQPSRTTSAVRSGRSR